MQVYAGAHTCVHACEDQWTILGAAPQELSTLPFFETGLAGLKFTKWARLIGQRANLLSPL